MPTDPPRVVTLGYTAVDHFMAVERFPVRGDKTRYRPLGVKGGGQAASAAVALRRWGVPVRYVGCVGDDHWGRRSVDWLDADGVITEGSVFRIPGAATQQAAIVLDETGDRTIFWHRDARLDLVPEMLDPTWFDTADLLLVDGHETSAAYRAAEWVRNRNGRVILDAEELPPGQTGLLRHVDLCVASSDFGARCWGIADPGSVLHRLAGYGIPIRAVTLGGDGVIADWGDGCRHFPAVPVTVRDTTGAGDVFHAACVYAALQNWPPARMMRFANTAAGLSCRHVGARDGIPSLPEIMKTLGSAGDGGGCDD